MYPPTHPLVHTDDQYNPPPSPLSLHDIRSLQVHTSGTLGCTVSRILPVDSQLHRDITNQIPFQTNQIDFSSANDLSRSLQQITPVPVEHPKYQEAYQ